MVMVVLHLLCRCCVHGRFRDYDAAAERAREEACCDEEDGFHAAIGARRAAGILDELLPVVRR
jgi:hypothetical protein